MATTSLSDIAARLRRLADQLRDQWAKRPPMLPSTPDGDQRHFKRRQQCEAIARRYAAEAGALLLEADSLGAFASDLTTRELIAVWGDQPDKVFLAIVNGGGGRKGLPSSHDQEERGYSYADAMVTLADVIDEGTPRPAPAGPKRQGEKQSWIQPELDAAITAEIAKYAEAITSASNGGKVARREIRRLFARNALADRLKIKTGSRGMVSVSKPWLELAEVVGLVRRSGRRGVAKVGLAIALEQRADNDDSSITSDAIHRETEGIIRAAINNARGKKAKAGLTELLDKFVLGEQTDAQARDIVATLRGE